MARKFICEPDFPVVQTKAGKLRGFVLDGIFTFHGIQYATAKRWQAPVPVTPWEGVKDATNYGFTAPTDGQPAPKVELLIPHRFWPESENCQYLNIWSTSIDPEAKRPVLVWFHGGGYADGSSIEQVSYEGDALAEYGDVVVVTVNHRLNILGHLDMSSFGEQYANSANAGIEDLVAALTWIRENIASFGGDPENVTIFGQSGGGGKVVTLLQTPAAKGLFHKAILMSGGAEVWHRSGSNHRDFIEGILEELQIPVAEAERLEKVPYSILMRAYHRVCRKKKEVISWGPKPNDWYVGHPLDVGFTDFAKTVPTIVSSTIAEFSATSDIDFTGMNAEQEAAALRQRFGEHTEEVTILFQNTYPEKPLRDLLMMDAFVRDGVLNFMQARAKESPAAPGYCYLFGLDFSIKGGTPAWHCSDIPFLFHNSHRVACCNIEDVTDGLEEEMAGCLISFSYTGNPNHGNLPKWEPYTTQCPASMVFDRKSFCRPAHDQALIHAMMQYGPAKPDLGAMFSIPEEEDDSSRNWAY